MKFVEKAGKLSYLPGVEPVEKKSKLSSEKEYLF